MMDPSKLATLLLLCLALVTQVTSDAVGWSYDTGAGGPNTWHLNYPDCGGVTQSPIDVRTDHVLYDPNLEYFDFSDYSRTEGVGMKLYNMGGHTAEVVLSGPKIYLRKGGLPAEYVVDQFHFHWGEVSERGSEHALNGHHFPMEMHIVHHQDRLGDASAASPHPNGLAVFAFFFEIGEHNYKYDHFIDYFDQISAADKSVDIPTFPLSDLLPEGDDIDFYRYSGSLTTPPCYESVIWTIATKTIKISESQIARFRTLRDHENRQLVDDFRPIQALNHRVVISTAEVYRMPGDSGNFLRASIFTLMSTLVIAIASRLF